MSAWIEILFSSSLYEASTVALHVSAWTEILACAGCWAIDWSHSMWVLD
ncbi:hypothetical protein [Paenibacillus polymyxa]